MVVACFKVDHRNRPQFLEKKAKFPMDVTPFNFGYRYLL